PDEPGEHEAEAREVERVVRRATERRVAKLAGRRIEQRDAVRGDGEAGRARERSPDGRGWVVSRAGGRERDREERKPGEEHEEVGGRDDDRRARRGEEHERDLITTDPRCGTARRREDEAQRRCPADQRAEECRRAVEREP